MKPLFLALLVSAPAHAAPAANPAARLFERATQSYGDARSLALSYRVTSDAPALQLEESGHVAWSKAGFYGQDFTYARGQGHVGADANTVYFTRVDGTSGRFRWAGFFGFWTALPWNPPGHLADLLRGRKMFPQLGARAKLQLLPPQQIEGTFCDGALVDLGAGQDKFRCWFARSDGLLRRESWQVVLPETRQSLWVQTRYFKLRLNPDLGRDDFINAAEADAPLVDPNSFEAN